MADTPITVEHNGITITYNERFNRWDFTLRGRERFSETLAKAREYIDRPYKEKPQTKFERVNCWYFRYSDVMTCTVTSIGVPRWTGSDPQVNITFKDEGRSKLNRVDSTAIYPQNEKNDALVAEWKQCAEQIKALREQQDAIIKKMKCYVLPKEEEPEKK